MTSLEKNYEVKLDGKSAQSSSQNLGETLGETLLRVEHLKTYFPITSGILFPKVNAIVKAVDDVSLTLKASEILGIVGESGCGKSTLGRSILKLIPSTEGKVTIAGVDITNQSHQQLRKMRTLAQMVFQDPYASLNPRMTVYDTLAEPLLIHGICSKKDVHLHISQLMNQVGLASRYIHKYPHEFSGGQRQRIAIARAIAVKPKLLIADEPVSALDVSIQSQILNLLLDLRKELKLAIIFISHDLSVVRYVSDRVAVMYLGKIVETGTAEALFANPAHPYTKALLSAIPLPDPDKEEKRQRVLLQGDPPSPLSPPSGCRFHPRCAYAIADCKTHQPELTLRNDHKQVACIRVDANGLLET